MSQSESAFDLPPDPMPDDPFDDEILPTKWPTVVGTLSIVLGALGLLCGTIGVGWSVFMDQLTSGMMQADIHAPPSIRIVSIVSALGGTLLALVLVIGGVGLVRRRRMGLAVTRVWAVLRVVWLLIALGLGLWLLPANIEYQMAIQEAQIKAAEADGREFPEWAIKTEDGAWLAAVISIAVGTVVTAIYPTFCIFYLSRRKIADEVRRWP